MHTSLRGKNLFILYIYSLPFSHAFAYLNGVVTFSLIIGILMAIFLVMNKSVYISTRLKRYLTLPFLFVIYLIFNGLINAQFYTSYWNHFFSYMASLIVFFVFPIIFLMSNKSYYNIIEINRAITNTTILTCFYSVCQFFFNNFLGINLDDFLHWGTNQVSNTMALGNFYRAKGFLAEPGHFAFFLEIMMPLTIYNIISSARPLSFKNVLIITLMFTAFVLTMSAAGWAFILLGIITTIVFNFYSVCIFLSKNWVKLVVPIFLVVGFIMYVSSYIPLFDMIIGNTLDKLDSGSSDDRLSRWKAFIEISDQMNYFDMIIGFGPNAMVNLGYPASLTLILLYPLLYVELGLIGLSLFILTFIIVFLKSVKIRGSIRLYSQVGLFSSLAHYSMISNYWYPYLWFLAVMIFYYSESCVRIGAGFRSGENKLANENY